MATDRAGGWRVPPWRWWSGPPRRQILFVCTANVCRSPLAHALLRDQLRQLGLKHAVNVVSAGCEVGSPGRRPDARVVKLAREKGLSLRGIRSRPLQARIVAASDEILVMERKHIDHIAFLYPHPDPVSRIRLLGSLLENPPGDFDGEIPDPYYADAATLARVWSLMEEAVAVLARQLAASLARPGT